MFFAMAFALSTFTIPRQVPQQLTVKAVLVDETKTKSAQEAQARQKQERESKLISFPQWFLAWCYKTSAKNSKERELQLLINVSSAIAGTGSFSERERGFLPMWNLSVYKQTNENNPGR